MKIKSFLITRLTHHELLGFFQIIVDAINIIPEEIEEIQVEMDNFVEAVAYYDKVLKPPVRTGLTPRIEELNQLCVQQWLGLRVDILNKTTSVDEALVDLAKKAEILMDTYQDVRRMNRSERSARIDNLLQDIKETFNTNEIKQLGLSLWMDELQRANNELKRLIKERTQMSQKNPPGAAVRARKEACACYYHLRDTLNVFSKKDTQNSNGIKYLITQINLVIDYEKPRLKARMTWAKKRQEGGEELPETPQPDVEQE